nr:unnamed protein product [Callosobruchus chinensis]
MPATWKRNQEKARRHASKGFPVPPRCSHDAGAFQCKTLKMQEIRRFHQNFYSNRTKIDQDRFLIKYIELNHKKEVEPQQVVPVCLDTFLKILHVSRFRLNILSKNFYATGQLPCERRGGDRKSIEYAPKKESVMNFLNKLKCVESHYC